MMKNGRPVLKADDLDVVGAQFGYRVVQRPIGQSDLIELYSEDDDNWHFVYSFAAFWLKDLSSVSELVAAKANTEIRLV